MVTIVEPQQRIVALWGKQKIKNSATYRLMNYLLRLDYDGKVLLHNVVTGQLVVLEHEEAEILEMLPTNYSPFMEQLVTDHFLVPESYDEHNNVKNMRSILRRLNEAQNTNDITMYTILTTTACNARCYYCFERGVKTVTMSEQTANDVVNFISAHCGTSKTVSIAWFGGEPTLTPNRIDQICTGLLNKGVSFSSIITTNGYLFDSEMISQAKSLWNLQSVNISMDGSEEKYNRIKSYVNPIDNPYNKVMNNIGLLLEQGIHVNLRMNFDAGNYYDFKRLLQDVLNRFGNNPFIHFFAHQINGEFPKVHDHTFNESEEWFSEKIVELNNLAREAGVFRKKITLPSLKSIGCKAAMASTVTITAEGKLVRCPEQFGDDQVTGNVIDGITNLDLVQSWKCLADYETCYNCFMYPYCLKILNCSVKERCFYRLEYRYLFQETIKQIFEKSQRSAI